MTVHFLVSATGICNKSAGFCRSGLLNDVCRISRATFLFSYQRVLSQQPSSGATKWQKPKITVEHPMRAASKSKRANAYRRSAGHSKRASRCLDGAGQAFRNVYGEIAADVVAGDLLYKPVRIWSCERGAWARGRVVDQLDSNFYVVFENGEERWVEPQPGKFEVVVAPRLALTRDKRRHSLQREF